MPDPVKTLACFLAILQVSCFTLTGRYRVGSMHYYKHKNEYLEKRTGAVCIEPIIDTVRDNAWEESVGWDSSNRHFWRMEDLTQYLRDEMERAGYRSVVATNKCDEKSVKVECALVDTDAKYSYFPFLYLKYRTSASLKCNISRSSTNSIEGQYQVSAKSMDPYFPPRDRLMSRVCARMSADFARELIEDLDLGSSMTY